MKLENIEEFDKLAQSEEKELCSFCNIVYSNPWFKRIIKRLAYDTMIETFDNADTLDKLQEGRFAVAGIKNIQEFFKRYSNRFEDKFISKK